MVKTLTRSRETADAAVQERTKALEQALAAARHQEQQVRMDWVRCKEQYRAAAAAARPDGKKMARLRFRQEHVLPELLRAAQLGVLKAEVELVESQIPAAEAAANLAAAEYEDAMRRLPHGGRLFADSPQQMQIDVGQRDAAYRAAKQQLRGLQGRLKQAKDELVRLTLKTNIDF